MDNDEQLVPELTVTDANTALVIYAACTDRSRQLARAASERSHQSNREGWQFTVAASVECHRVAELAWGEYLRLHAENAQAESFTNSLPADSGETTRHADTRQ